MAQPSSSWFPGADGSDFGIRNIPFGVCTLPTGATAIVTRIGDHVVNLGALSAAGLLDASCGAAALQEVTLNSFMAAGRATWRAARARLQALLAAEGEPGIDGALRGSPALLSSAVLPAAEVTMKLPATVGDYTDFYSSRDHAHNVGVMIRGPANALQPNWLWLPVGYHGRASSVVPSGTPIRRPCGQLQVDPKDPTKGAVLGPTARLDFELEMGTWVGPGNALGEPIAMADAEAHIFGMCLMNDWSARDVQVWEYVPLGPFLAKNFATTVSPWVVTLDALEPFRAPTTTGRQEPPPLPYLVDPHYDVAGSYDVQLEVAIKGAGMAEEGVVARSNYRHMYWNLRQQLVHHAVSGCNMQPGDLLGSGTISGPVRFAPILTRGAAREVHVWGRGAAALYISRPRPPPSPLNKTQTPESRGSMLELSWKGEANMDRKPVELPGGETRVFLKDGDTVTMRGVCVNPATGERVGFGECVGTVLPARAL